jgi:NADH dehydrogenase
MKRKTVLGVAKSLAGDRFSQIRSDFYMKRILVLGGGFAGLWSAIGAARKLDELGIGSESIEVVLLNRDAYHSIRVRNYEADLSTTRVLLDDVLEPVGISRLQGDVIAIDLQNQTVSVAGAAGQFFIPYDRLVFALGSQLSRPNIPGLTEYGFSVDTYNEASQLNAHLNELPDRPDAPGQYTVLVVGAGLTGIEAATEIPGKLRTAIQRSKNSSQDSDRIHTILADHNPQIGSDMGDSARPIIQEALTALGIETRTGVSVVSIERSGATLTSGEFIPTATVIWTAGMKANPLTQCFPIERDRWGRIPVDEYMKVKGIQNVFAAGDAAWTMVDKIHSSVMSCQHGRPMGRFAGHNVVCDLLGEPMLPLRIEWYATILDLGPWGAVYTEGWERVVVSKGESAKKTKQTINCQRIYPPLTGNRREILDAATPIIQIPPAVHH